MVEQEVRLEMKDPFRELSLVLVSAMELVPKVDL